MTKPATNLFPTPLNSFTTSALLDAASALDDQEDDHSYHEGSGFSSDEAADLMQDAQQHCSMQEDEENKEDDGGSESESESESESGSECEPEPNAVKELEAEAKEVFDKQRYEQFKH
jgi:hypothetical protein